MRHKVKQLLAFSMAICPSVLMANSTDWMQLAASLLSQHQASEAVSVLEPHMEEYAGELEYDFLLGQAALANNQANLAVFALERAILTSPEQDGARYVLAKAYATLGETTQARKELGYIIKTSKNNRYKELSKNMLGQMSNRKSAKFNLNIRAGVGSDSNANSATEKDKFLGVDLSPNSQAKPSTVALGQIFGNVNYPLTDKASFVAGADIFKYDYADATFVNTTGYGVNSGIFYRYSKKTQDSVQVQARRTEVDNSFNNQQFSAQVSHNQKLNKTDAITASLRGGRINYANEFSVRNISQFNFGIQYQNTSLNKDRDLFQSTLSVIAGKDDPVRSNSKYGRTYTGMQTGAVLGHRSGLMNVQGNLSYVSSQYDNYIGMERNENNMAASLTLNLKFKSDWLVSPGVNYIRNKSSIDLFDFERTQLTFVVSHQLI